MKKYIYAFCLSLISNVYASDFRVRDGKIAFALGTVNGKVVWDESEKQKEIDKFVPTVSTPSAIVVNFIPSKTEINISTCVKTISPNLLRTPTKNDMIAEISEIKRLSDIYNDLDPTGQKTEDYRARYNYLKAYYNTLP